MSYAGMGIAIPMGVTARRGVTARGVTARGVTASRGITARLLGLAGLGAVDGDAFEAVRAVLAATETARRRPIAAVRTFQLSYGHGLTADGIYGPNTRAALVSVLGRADLPPVPPAASGGGSTAASSGSYVSTTSTTPVVDSAFAVPDAAPGMPAWLVPVAIVGTLTVVGGGILMMKRRTPPKAPVMKRRMNRRRRA